MIVRDDGEGTCPGGRVDADRNLIPVAAGNRHAVGDLSDRERHFSVVVTTRNELGCVLGKVLLAIVLKGSPDKLAIP
jgi:hypothetical protein